MNIRYLGEWDIVLPNSSLFHIAFMLKFPKHLMVLPEFVTNDAAEI
jgi:hypothetical protein